MPDSRYLHLDRRRFLASAVGSTMAFCAGSIPRAGADSPGEVPAYLAGYERLYAENPRRAAAAWFREARFGLFLHYSLRSLAPNPRAMAALSRDGDWRRAAYERFTAERFDADAIADLAAAAGMQYVNITTYHNSGPFLFRTATSEHTSLGAPARRDLVGELAAACAKRRLGLFLYIYPTHAESSSPRGEANRTILRELLTQYGPVAGVWFDGVYRAYRERELFRDLQSHYDLIRRLQPQTLISFKVGYTGDEDFLAPEHYPRTIDGNRNLPPEVRRHQHSLPVEICTTLQVDPETGSGQQMWHDRDDARRLDAEEVLQRIEAAWEHPANLLLNTGLRGDGSIHPHDEATLREVGKRLRRRPG